MECPHAYLRPLSAHYLADPYAVFASMREPMPVFFDAELDSFVVTRHGDIEAIFRDSDTFSAANAQDPVFPLHDDTRALLADVGFRKIRTMSNLDGPEHARIRHQNQIGFSPRRLRLLEPIIRSSTQRLLDSTQVHLDTSGCSDFVAQLAFPLSASIIFALLGFPEEDTELLKSWCGDRMAFSWGRPTASEQTTIAHDMIAYWTYCEAHVQRRVESPADDFTTDLLRIHDEDPAKISRAEIAHIIYGLSFAGHETTTNLLTNTLRAVMESGAWPTLCADPSRIANAVDEALRFDTSVLTWRRITTMTTTVGGVDLPANAKLVLLLGSANRDPTVFPDPDHFDLDRTNANRHLSFGFGKHYCLGATLAKIEVAVVLEELTKRLPQLRLDANQTYEFHPNISFRGPRQLLMYNGF